MNHQKERAKKAARGLLARLIPIDEWMAIAPRLPGDLAVYRSIEMALQQRAQTGRGTPRLRPGEYALPVSAACLDLDDETIFFRFDDEPATRR